MVRACCALCGASNPILRVYVGMQSPRPNLVPLACTTCGKVSSQLRSLGDYLTFSVAYAAIALLLLVVALQVAGDTTNIEWYATIAALVPFSFMPAWWAAYSADRIEAEAPTEDLTVAEKLVYMLITIAVVAVVIGGGLYVYLLWVL